MKRNNLIALVLALTLCLSLAACGGQSTSTPETPAKTETSEPAEPTPAPAPTVDFPTKNITLLIPWAAGSSGDNGARLLMPYVEEALGGATITVENKPGASGWLGWDEVAAANPDGYTISLLTLPSFYGGYMNPANNRTTNLDNFQMIANQVSDWATLYCQAGETRWSDFNGMIEYAKTHELVIGASGVDSDDNMMVERMKALCPDIKLSTVQGQSSGEVKPMLLGGHIDLWMANVGDGAALFKNGELDALCVFAPEACDMLPGVPTFNELTGEDLVAGSDRGYFMPAGADPEVVKILQDAFEEAINNPEHIAGMTDLGINVNYMSGDDLAVYAKNTETEIAKLKPVLGWE